MMRLIVITIALVAGLGAGALGFVASQQEPVQAAVVTLEEPEVDVLALRDDLLRGTQLSADSFMWTSWPEKKVRPGMVQRTEQPDAMAEFSGRQLRSNVYAQEPLREQHLSDGDGGYLALALQPNMRAIGVSVGATKTAGGFIMPNDRVDVMLTVVRDIDGDGSASGATRTILTNVRVLAIGGTTMEQRRPPKTMKPKTAKDEDTKLSEKPPVLIGKTATLEVSPRQAEVLLAATASGSLSLALRAAEDFGLSGMGDLAMIEASDELAPPAPASTSVTATPKREVTIISGGSARIFTSAKPAEETSDD